MSPNAANGGGNGGGASANDVLADLPNPPNRTTIRTILRILEQKGHLTHTLAGREFIYRPVASHAQVGSSALHSVLRAFFGNSLPNALAVYFADPKTRLSPADHKRLAALIRQAKERGQ